MPSSKEVAEFGLREYGRIVWRHKGLILLLGLVAAGASVAINSQRTPVYRSTANLLLISPVSAAVGALSVSNVQPVVDVPTAAKVIASSSTQKAVSAALRTSTVPSASVTEQGLTYVVTIAVDSPRPAFAARVANEYATVYITSTQRATVASLDSASMQLDRRLSALGAQITGLQKQIDAMPETKGTTQSAAIVSLQTQEASLVAEQSTLKEQVSSLQDDATLATGNGQVVGQAAISDTPISPHRNRDAALAGALGLVAGIGLALLRTFLDDRIRSEDDVRLALGDLPVLGFLPVMRSWRKKTVAPLIIGTTPKSTTAEAFRKIRTAIQFTSLDDPVCTILITSPISSDGKTTISANLAATMAQGGQRVLLMGGDLRNPLIHEHFGLSNEVGFTSVLLGEVRLADAIQDAPGVDGLRVLAAGPIPPNPSELLASPRTRKVIQGLATYADIVIIDTTPVLPVADASILAAQVDAVVLIVSASVTKRSEASQAAEVLSQVKANVIGTVVNRVPESGNGALGYGYGYRYGYGYGSDQAVRTRSFLRGDAHHRRGNRSPVREERARRAVLAGGDNFDPENVTQLEYEVPEDAENGLPAYRNGTRSD